MKQMQYFLLVLLLSLSSLSLQAEESPGRIVKKTVNKVLFVLRDPTLVEKDKRKFIFELVKERVNFQEMARRILAVNWKNATGEQKQEFVALFEEILLESYWQRIRHYAGQRIEYITESRDKKDFATVDTVIIRDNNVDIPISYRMRRLINLWLAYDFIVEDLSLVQSYRTEYSATVKNVGIDGLIIQMQREVDGYNLE